MKKYSLALLGMVPGFALAANIAIVDSGTDYRHPMLVNNYALNVADTIGDGQDNDGDGYADDYYGWNFAENNNEVIDYSYLGKFSGDTKKFFEVQTRILKGTATQADKDWMNAKRGDSKFLQELQTFGNFVHGTHVAGISVRDQADNKVFAVKLIPTEVKLPFSIQTLSASNPATADMKEMLFAMALEKYAGMQAKALNTIGQYLAARHADVMNGSFGTGFPQAKQLVEALYNQVWKEGERDPAKVEQFTKDFLNAMVREGRAFVDASPDTLFVFAAGNDGSNNDVFPTSPTNIKADNEISVAATLDNQSLATFSNFGLKMVEVAAPGVGIESSIPGNEMMLLSGTSQAAPYVTNVAARVKSANPALKPVEVKQIIMATVDAKAWLKDKVLTGGVVNPARAAYAANLSKTTDIYTAIAEAKKNVAETVLDVRDDVTPFSTPGSKEEAMVLPLPGLFY